jgi:hypothetical protein
MGVSSWLPKVAWCSALMLALSEHAVGQVPCRLMSDPASCGEDKVKLSISQDRAGGAREKAVFILTYGVLTQVQLAAWAGRLALSVEKVAADRVELRVGANVRVSLRGGDAVTFSPKTPAEVEALGRSPISFRAEP